MKVVETLFNRTHNTKKNDQLMVLEETKTLAC